MTKSGVKSITVEPAEESLTIDHFEDAAGNTITTIEENKVFYIVGYYKKDDEPMANKTVYVYQTDVSGNPDLTTETSDTTDSTGKFTVSYTAPSVTTSTELYFRAYSADQKP